MSTESAQMPVPLPEDARRGRGHADPVDGSLASDADASVAGTWEVETITGSLYRVRLDCSGRWLLSACNVPNPRSLSLADGEWEIEPPSPWPPLVGVPLVMLAPQGLEMRDSRRVPGGGKITSDVRLVRSLPLAVSLLQAEARE